MLMAWARVDAAAAMIVNYEWKPEVNDGKNWTRVALAIALSVSLLNLNACNTVQGFGKDIEKLGDKIEKKAEQKKQ